MKFFKSFKDFCLSLIGSKSTKPKLHELIVIERLEPRIFLSGDGLLYSIASDPLQDALLDNTQNVVQYVELLDTAAQVEQHLPTAEQEIHQDGDSSNRSKADLYQPILTLSVDDSNVTEDGELIDANVHSVDGFNETSENVSFGETETVTRQITAEYIKYLAKHPRVLYEMSPRQFEELIAEILASCGWQVALTPESKDGGYDIFGISKDEILGVPTSWIIECKRYNPKHKVGIEKVRAFLEVKANLKVANAMLTTTSYFTRGAKDYEAQRYDLELKDNSDVMNWINTYRPNPSGKLYLKNNGLVLPK